MTVPSQLSPVTNQNDCGVDHNGNCNWKYYPNKMLRGNLCLHWVDS